jgi:hypothetical protein
MAACDEGAAGSGKRYTRHEKEPLAAERLFVNFGYD